MTHVEFLQALDTLGLPVGYIRFSEPTSPPFIILRHQGSADMMADNANYFEIQNYRVEFYSRYKDPPTENRIQQLFRDHRLPYKKWEFFIDTENLIQIIYEVQIHEEERN